MNQSQSPSMQVQVYDYTIHWLRGDLTRKMGSCCMLRRNFSGCSILVYLMRTTAILKISAEALGHFLSYHRISIRKSSTKAAKIRALMKAPEIQEKCSQEILDRMEALLVAIEERRNKKAGNKDVLPEDMDEDAEKDEAGTISNRKSSSRHIVYHQCSHVSNGVFLKYTWMLHHCILLQCICRYE